MRARFLLAVVCVSLAGCRGTVPRAGGVREQGISAVLIGGRFILPTGETRSGEVALNLDGEGGRRAEVYRLPINAAQSQLYQVEPGLYRVSPTRSPFGTPQAQLQVKINGAKYSVPFPRDILRRPPLDIKAKRIVPIGVLEIKLPEAMAGQKVLPRIRLDDSVETRRLLVQRVIHDMMDPEASPELRESAVSWSRALENSLLDLLSESERSPLYKPAP